MKKLKLHLSQNGWEYVGIAILQYKESYKVGYSDTIEYTDRRNNKAPNIITLDNEYTIVFDEAFEIIDTSK